MAVRQVSGIWFTTIALIVASPTSARSESMRDCVERGGVYLENGTCEMQNEDAARNCRHQGGRYLSNGQCDVPQPDPEERCRDAGGFTIQNGRCYKLRTRDD